MKDKFTKDFKIKYVIYFGSILILGFVIMVTISILTDDSEDFTLITNETEVIGRVSNVERNHGTVFFNLNDSLKYKVRGSDMNNYAYTDESFFFFLMGNDWIEKRTGTDTLLIERQIRAGQSENFIFAIGKQLNAELKK
ncbi:MAG: hypothetical protein ABI663_11965 [Chryseolinea sp.]